MHHQYTQSPSRRESTLTPAMTLWKEGTTQGRLGIAVRAGAAAPTRSGAARSDSISVSILSVAFLLVKIGCVCCGRGGEGFVRGEMAGRRTPKLGKQNFYYTPSRQFNYTRGPKLVQAMLAGGGGGREREARARGGQRAAAQSRRLKRHTQNTQHNTRRGENYLTQSHRPVRRPASRASCWVLLLLYCACWRWRSRSAAARSS